MKSFPWLPLLLILLTVASLMAPLSHATLALSPGDIIVTDMYQGQSGAPGVFRQSPSGGAPTAIFTGPPYVNPTGVAIVPESARPVGGFIEPVNKLAVFAPYMALFGVIAAVAIVVAAPWKKREN